MAGFTLAYSQMTPWQDAFKHKFTRETAAQIPGILGVPPVGTEPQPTDITLHGRAWRTRYGNSYARLVWSGAHGGTVSVWRNGTRLMRTPKRRPVRELPRPTPRDVRLRAARCRRPALEPDHAHRVGAGRDSSRRRGDPRRADSPIATRRSAQATTSTSPVRVYGEPGGCTGSSPDRTTCSGTPRSPEVRDDAGSSRRRRGGPAMRAASAAPLLVAAAACVRVPRGAGFDDVQRSLSTRTESTRQ